MTIAASLFRTFLTGMVLVLLPAFALAHAKLIAIAPVQTSAKGDALIAERMENLLVNGYRQLDGFDSVALKGPSETDSLASARRANAQYLIKGRIVHDEDATSLLLLAFHSNENAPFRSLTIDIPAVDDPIPERQLAQAVSGLKRYIVIATTFSPPAPGSTAAPPDPLSTYAATYLRSHARDLEPNKLQIILDQLGTEQVSDVNCSGGEDGIINLQLQTSSSPIGIISGFQLNAKIEGDVFDCSVSTAHPIPKTLQEISGHSASFTYVPNPAASILNIMDLFTSPWLKGTRPYIAGASNALSFINVPDAVLKYRVSSAVNSAFDNIKGCLSDPTTCPGYSQGTNPQPQPMQPTPPSPAPAPTNTPVAAARSTNMSGYDGGATRSQARERPPASKVLARGRE